MQLTRGLLLGRFRPPVVTARRGDAGVAHQLLYGHDVNAPVQHVAGEGAAKVVRAEFLEIGLGRPPLEHVVDRLAGQTPPRRDLIDVTKQRTRLETPQRQPVRNRVQRAVRGVDQPLLAPLAAYPDLPALQIDVVDVQVHQLRPAQRAGVKQPNHRRVAHASRFRVGHTDVGQRQDLALLQITPGRQTLRLDVPDRGRPLIILAADVAQLPGDPQNPAQSRQDAVHGAWRVLGGEGRADGGRVLFAQRRPVNVEGALLVGRFLTLARLAIRFGPDAGVQPVGDQAQPAQRVHTTVRTGQAADIDRGRVAIQRSGRDEGQGSAVVDANGGRLHGLQGAPPGSIG